MDWTVDEGPASVAKALQRADAIENALKVILDAWEKGDDLSAESGEDAYYTVRLALEEPMAQARRVLEAGGAQVMKQRQTVEMLCVRSTRTAAKGNGGPVVLPAVDCELTDAMETGTLCGRWSTEPEKFSPQIGRRYRITIEEIDT